LKVVICDDDPAQRESIRLCFEISENRHEFEEFEFGNDTVDYIRHNDPDILFLDMGLPDIDGQQVLEKIRETSDIPVIIISGYHAINSVAKALASGADDYITKPFEPIILMARVEAVTRRTSSRITNQTEFKAGKLEANFSRHVAHYDGDRIELNRTEWKILRALTVNPGLVVTYRELKTSAWGSDDVSDAAVHMAIRRLRGKLGGESAEDGQVKSHRGIGYSFES
jgi:two-component system KDP operon response regulator KdpE